MWYEHILLMFDRVHHDNYRVLKIVLELYDHGLIQ